MKVNHAGRYILLLCAWLLLWHGAAGRPARAENLGPGGGTRIIVGDEVVGPYRLLVTSAPEPAQVGTVTFAVRISDPATGDKVLDADVAVELVHSQDGSTVSGPATHEDAGNPIDYAAHLQIEKPGIYNGAIRIQGPAGAAEVTFTQRVLAPRQFSTVLLIGLPFLAILGIAAAMRRRRPR